MGCGLPFFLAKIVKKYYIFKKTVTLSNLKRNLKIFVFLLICQNIQLDMHSSKFHYPNNMLLSVLQIKDNSNITNTYP